MNFTEFFQKAKEINLLSGTAVYKLKIIYLMGESIKHKYFFTEAEMITESKKKRYSDAALKLTTVIYRTK
jgi:hypothetical protein